MTSKVPIDFEFGDSCWIIRKNWVDNQIEHDDGEVEIIFEDGSSVSTDEPDLVALVHPWEEMGD